MCRETLFVKGTEFGIIQIFINVMKTAISMNPGVSGSGLMQYCMEQSLFLFILCDWNDSWHPCELVCCTIVGPEYTLYIWSALWIRLYFATYVTTQIKHLFITPL